MGRQSGFVPIPFHIVGKILLAGGITGSVLIIISKVGGWYSSPRILTLSCLAAMVVGLYLIYVVPRESLE